MYYNPGSVPLNKEKTWDCYLPEGTGWYNFWTGDYCEGGQTVTVDSPMDTLPLFVRAGSIVPMEEGLQYADQVLAQPVQLHIFPGTDAEFRLYRDSGDGYAYENGEYSCLNLSWNDAEYRITLEDCGPIAWGSEDFTVIMKNNELSLQFNEVKLISHF